MIQAISNKHLEDKFNRYLVVALTFHAFIIIIGMSLNTLLDLNLFETEKARKNLEIIQSSVRVDVVAMPKFTVQELKKMEVKPPAEDIKGSEVEAKKEIEIKPDDVVVEKVKKKIDLKNLLSNLGKKEKKIAKNKGSKSGKLDSTSKRQLQKLILEGNKVSAGTSTVGDTTSLNQTKFTKYVSSLPNYVRPHWKLPSYLMERSLKCRIRLFIAANGKILNSEIYESSGVEEFDQKALSSLKNIQSFPEPEVEIVSRLASGEVVLGFPL